MCSLPCAANGSQDAVRLALTGLSKELLDTNSTGVQAGGCDSSDCLFCQYRSNSPFHLNAYAGKLTSLLGKRRLNGMALPSWGTFTDTSSQQEATTVMLGSGGKRQKAADSDVMLPSKSEPTAFSGPATSPAVGDTVREARTGIDRDRVTRCRSGHCEGVISRCIATGVTNGATVASSSAATPAVLTSRGAPSKTSSSAVSGTVLPQTTGKDHESSSLSNYLYHRLQPHEHNQAQALTQLQPHHHHSQRCPTNSQALPLHRQESLELTPSAGEQPGYRQGSSAPPQPRLLLGQALPHGWSFQTGWEHRQDPAPAELRHVLSLPAATATSRHGDGVRQGAVGRGVDSGGSFRPGVVYGCQGAAGIVCALEFSPDGRLLAAGGVDKQIRLYNLSEAFGNFDGTGGDDDSQVDDSIPCGDSDDTRDVSGPQHLREPCAGHHVAPSAPALPRSAVTRSLYRRCTADSDGEDDGDHGHLGCCSLLAAVQRMPSKISSMAWSPHADGVLTVGDYDGVLLQLHIASGHQLADVEAHGGRKIWSVAHSTCTPHLVASAADDHCARLWVGRGLSTCVATLQPNPRASICSVDFSDQGNDDQLLALACSDRTVYLYDMRSLGSGPLAALRHHSRPTSYCRFMGPGRLVTAATDASVALWDVRGAVSGTPNGALEGVVSTCGGGGDVVPRRVFRGHRNEKNFVGLSVRAADGLVACGSECSRAFAYHTSWSDPLATLGLPAVQEFTSAVPVGPQPQAGGSGCGGGFVSAVCWQPAEAASVLGLPPLLASATSFGAVGLSALAARH